MTFIISYIIIRRASDDIDVHYFLSSFFEFLNEMESKEDPILVEVNSNKVKTRIISDKAQGPRLDEIGR